MGPLRASHSQTSPQGFSPLLSSISLTVIPLSLNRLSIHMVVLTSTSLISAADLSSCVHFHVITTVPLMWNACASKVPLAGSGSENVAGIPPRLLLSTLITVKIARGEKRAMERTCVFVISDCLPFSRQIDFYVSCYWKLSGLGCQACLALASAAKPISGLYDLALGRTFKAFNSQVIPMVQ